MCTEVIDISYIDKESTIYVLTEKLSGKLLLYRLKIT